eukprot:m.14439 g.14439  ORF g.14439 m.14439 type:complete len:189 (+) comp6293_c0_seq1:189-755(+)
MDAQAMDITVDELSTTSLPGALNRKDVAKLPTEAQQALVNELSTVNRQLATSILEAKAWLEEQSEVTPRLKQLVKAVQTDPTASMTEQYEDFGLWDLCKRSTEQSLSQATSSIAQAKSTATDAIPSTMDDPTKAYLRMDLTRAAGDDIDTLREDPAFGETSISILINSLEMGHDLLTHQDLQLLQESR